MIRYTLITDGSSDIVLIEILDWLMGQLTEDRFHGEWVDLRILRDPPRSLEDRARLAIEIHPCDILMVHRDAERERREKRREEIYRALGDVQEPPIVCVIPVRMQETWLLFDEMAIRHAAGKPRGRMALSLPAVNSLERVANPKERLHTLLKTASGRSGRRLHQFDAGKAVHRLAHRIVDFSPIRELPAFISMEEELREALSRLQQ